MIEVDFEYFCSLRRNEKRSKVYENHKRKDGEKAHGFALEATKFPLHTSVYSGHLIRPIEQGLTSFHMPPHLPLHKIWGSRRLEALRCHKDN